MQPCKKTSSLSTRREEVLPYNTCNGELVLRATGGVSMRSDSRQLEDLVGKKPGALLALLALSLGRTRLHEEVIDLIWPEVDFDNTRNRFKQTLAALRKQLEPTGVAPGSVLIADRSQVGIAAEHKSDVAEFGLSPEKCEASLANGS